MNNSIITGQVQSIMQKMMLDMLERLLKKLEGGGQTQPATGDTPTTTSTVTGSANTPVTGNFSSIINQAAQKYGVNPELVQAVIKAESNFNPRATSYCGAAGLMQLMPATARSLGVTDIYDPAQNIEGGVKFLSGLLSHFHGNTQLAVAAYNAGPGAVDRYGGIPPYSETQTYVKRVMGYFQTNNQWSG